MKAFVFGLSAALAFFSAAEAQTLPEWSVWKNQRSSLLIVSKVDPANGTFIGSFINNAQGYRCQGVSVPVSGRVKADDVSFVANFAPCDNTMTVWKGTVSGPTMATSFILWYIDSNYEFQEIRDQDTFTKQN